MGWAVKKLSEICTNIFAGGDVPKDRLSKFRTDKFGVPIYANGEKNKGLYGFTDEARVLEPSITVSARGTIGYSEVRSEPFFPVVRLIVLTPNLDVVDLQYLKYVVSSMEFKNSGSSIPQLTVPMIKDYQCELPPIPEQKRIVAILYQAFADIDLARAKTEQNLKNARELFDSYLQQVFSQRGEGWVETMLGNEIELLTGFAFKSKEYVTHSDSVPLIRGDNIVQGKLRWEGVKLWSKDKVSGYEKYQLAENDIVLAMDRTWVKAGMKFSRITDKDLPALLVQRVARLRCLSDLDSDFLYYLIGSKLFENYVLSIQTGLGVPHISGKQIQSFTFNRPDMQEQKLVVVTLNRLADNVLHLTEIYESKMFALDELKKSILQKAFTGQLTAKDAA